MLLYFVIGIGNTATENTLILGIIISLLSFAIFVCCILYVREKDRL